MPSSRKLPKISTSTDISTVASGGRVTLPQRVRLHLGLEPGDKLAFTTLSDGRVVLRPKGRRLAQLAGMLTRPGQPSVSRVELLSLPGAEEVELDSSQSSLGLETELDKSTAMSPPALFTVDVSRREPTPPMRFWKRARRGSMSPVASRAAFSDLVVLFQRSPSLVLHKAIEDGVPTYLVDLIARVMRWQPSRVIEMLGLSPTTLRRKELANQPLPELAGHRMMGLLRIAATLRRMLCQDRELAREPTFDFESWLGDWLLRTHPELGGRTPANLLRNPEGLRAVEQLVQRMSGGLPA